MRSLRYLSGLIVCIFVSSGGQSVDAMGLEARVKDLHGSLVSLKKKLTSLRDGLQEVKNSLAGHGSKKLGEQRPLPPTPHTSIETLIKSENRLFLASAAFSKIEHAETYKALEKVLLNNQGSLTEKEKEIIAYVIAILLHLNAELAKEKIEEIQENKPISSATKKIILNYFKSNFGKNSDAKALLERIKPKITMTEVAPSSGSLPVSGPAPLVTPVESPTPPVGGQKSPPPAPKLPDKSLSPVGASPAPKVKIGESLKPVADGSGDLLNQIKAGKELKPVVIKKETLEEKAEREAKETPEQKAQRALKEKTEAVAKALEERRKNLGEDDDDDWD